jgi:hypothetical protein
MNLSQRADSSDTLRLSGRPYHRLPAPYLGFYVDRFFPDAWYEALAASFPAESWFVRTIEGDKRLFGTYRTLDVFTAFCDTAPAWKRAVDAFVSPAFLADLQQVVADGLAGARGRDALRPWHTEDAGGEGGGDRVVVTAEFSRLPNGASVPAHTDDPLKLVSLLFYVPSHDWRPEYGGGTEFFVPHARGTRHNWYNRRVPVSALRSIGVVDFVPNRLVVFVKTRDSYHAVRPVSCPPGSGRTSCNVNVLLSRPAESIGRRVGSVAERILGAFV